MTGSSSAPRVLQPSPAAVESICRPASLPDAKLTAKFLASCRRLKERAKRNKLGAVATEVGDTYGAVSKLDVAVRLLNLIDEIPWAGPVAKALQKLYGLYTVCLGVYPRRSSSHAAPCAQTMKGNAEDVEDLREVTEDLIGIVARRINQLGEQARADIEELHKCAQLSLTL